MASGHHEQTGEGGSAGGGSVGLKLPDKTVVASSCPTSGWSFGTEIFFC